MARKSGEKPSSISAGRNCLRIPGQALHGGKRFSLEGGEGAIVLLDAMIKRCPAAGVSHIEMGMAHRGRLNVLANILHKPLKTIFHEFTPDYLPESPIGRSDVKYHLGYAATRHVDGHDLHIRLSSNPSHLEAVYPVVEGRARAMQHNLQDAERKHVLPLVLHGDAAFSGQGIVAEVLNLSLLKGYRTGGTVHLVINNQIGFTTGPDEARSSRYATDVARCSSLPSCISTEKARKTWCGRRTSRSSSARNSEGTSFWTCTVTAVWATMKRIRPPLLHPCRPSGLRRVPPPQPCTERRSGNAGN